jgi:hypothetical protein|tara:strand:- start:25 stop:207 length:183 start_codon:yes stop_codon:yes gene_type:complete
MCLICVELTQNKLTAMEARRNLGEWVHTIKENHREDVMKAIWKKEDEERDRDLICDYGSD